MIRKGIIIFFLFMVPIGFSLASLPKTQTIIFIRHGEKPFLDYGQLKCEGWNRALQVPQLIIKKFGKPNALFAPHPYFNNFFYYVRGVTTIEPFAIQLNLLVHNDYLYFEIDKVVAELLNPKYQSAMVFVVWEHLNLTKIARKLMRDLGMDEKKVPRWSSRDFDSIYVFEIDWSGQKPKVQFSHQQQQLNSQSKICYTPKTVVTTVKNRQLLFVPSAEADLGVDQLNCKGLNRAMHLATWFWMYIPKINRVILPKPDKHLFLRSLLTIEPTLISRGGAYIPEAKDAIELTREFSSRLNCCETVVIGWNIENLGFVLRSVYQAQGGDPREIEDRMIEHDAVYEIALNTGQKPQFYKHSTYFKDVSDQCPMILR